MAAKKRKTKTDHRTRVGHERSARTETRILEAALGVFAAMGPDAPKIDDFVAAAGIARGTFYNHFDSVDALLAATSEWTTRELIETIEGALEGIEGPTLRFGVGLRLFFAKAAADRVWSQFVGRVWRVGGLELPLRDLEEGMRTGELRAEDPDVAQDLLLGGVREAMLRIGREGAAPTYGARMTALCLKALGADAKRIAAVMKHELPAMGRGNAAE